MKLSELKIKLRAMLNETFRNVSTDKGVISWDSDNELPEVDERVWSIDENGQEIQVEDGDYTLEDGTVISIAENKVAKVVIPEPKAEEEPSSEEEPAQEEPQEPENEPEEPAQEEEPSAEEEPASEEPEMDEKDARIAELEARIAELEAENAELKARIAELEAKSAASPAEEEFKRVNKLERPTDKKLARLYDLMNA